MDLQPGDVLIMMSDGIYDAPGPAVNKELWMKRLIQEVYMDTPQDMAESLLDKVMRYHQGEIHDDMTVVVAKNREASAGVGNFPLAGHDPDGTT